MATDQSAAVALDDEATLLREPLPNTPLKHRERLYTSVTGVRPRPDAEDAIVVDPNDMEELEATDKARADAPSVPPPPPALTRQIAHQEPAQRIDDAVIAFSLLRPGEDQHALGTILERMGDEPALALISSRACSLSLVHRADLIGQVIGLVIKELPKLREAERAAREARMMAECAVKTTFEALSALQRGAQ